MNVLDAELEPRHHGTETFHFAYYDNYEHNPDLDQDIIILHWHPEAEFLYVRERPMLVRVDDEVIRVEPGEVVYIPRGAIHSAEAPDNGVIRYDAVVFDLEMIASSTLDACQVNVVHPILNHTRRLPIHLTASTERLTAVLAELEEIRKAYFVRSPGRELLIKGALCKVFALLFEAGDTVPQRKRDEGRYWDRLKPVISHIHDHFSEELHLDQLAAVANMSKFHFCRVFKEITGKSPASYITEYRIREAQRRLKESDSSVTEIAFDVGFNDLTYFGRAFRRHWRCTPTEFREQR